MRDGEELFKNFDMALYSKKTFGMFGGEEESVTLKCENRLAGVIIDRFGEDVTLLKSDDKHFEVHIKAHISPLFFGWVLNFGNGIEIVAPSTVREEFCTLLKNTLKQYN